MNETSSPSTPPEMPPLSGSPSKRPVLAIVMLAVVAGLVLLMIYVASKNTTSSASLIERQADEFALQRGRETPTPPKDRGRELQPEPDPEPMPSNVELERMAGRLAELQERERMALEERDRQENEKAAEEAHRKAEARRKSPLMILSNNATATGPASTDDTNRLADTPSNAPPSSQTAQDGAAAPYAFLQPATASAAAPAAQAAIRADLSWWMLQGKLVPAVLDGAIDSTLPGAIRAVVSRDVYSEDGLQLLIPAGSRVLGEYRSGVVRGQSRVAVVWHRLFRPDGVEVALRGQGVDALGKSGFDGDLDTHFWERFGGAVLLSLIDIAGSGSDETQVIAGDLQSPASIALQNSINVPPTIHVDQGTAIQIIVGQDLDFSRVPPLAMQGGGR